MLDLTRQIAILQITFLQCGNVHSAMSDRPVVRNPEACQKFMLHSMIHTASECRNQAVF